MKDESKPPTPAPTPQAPTAAAPTPQTPTPQAASAAPAPAAPAIPDAHLVEKRRLSVVWVIPLVAALIGGWLTWKSVTEKGPAFTLTFPTADGLEAGKTKIRFRELEIGVVETLTLSPDLDHVIAQARLSPGLDRYLNENTQFWVVRAQVSAGQVTGLGTLLSGAYIGIDPVADGAPRRAFEGLVTPPLVTSRQAGTRFVLHAPSQGSLDVGVPVHFRQVQVGEVVRSQLEPDGQSVTIDVFVHAPHDQRIRTTTRWWNASGFDATVNQDGLRIETQSFLSMLIGGVAFDTPTDTPGVIPEPGAAFDLFPNRAASERPNYAIKRRYLARFDGSAKGLNKGSTVEFLGARIGTVVDVHLELDAQTGTFTTPVVLELEPERVQVISGGPDQVLDRIEALVGEGLRARLESGNLLTGGLVVNLDVDRKGTPGAIVRTGALPELPTIPKRLDELAANVARLVEKIEQVPLAEIGDEFARALTALRGTLEESRGAARQANQDLLPDLAKTMSAARTTLEGIQKTLDATQHTLKAAQGLVAPAAPSIVELQRLMAELTQTARSFRMLAEQLDRNPENLLSGKSAP